MVWTWGRFPIADDAMRTRQGSIGQTLSADEVRGKSAILTIAVATLSPGHGTHP